MKLVVCPASQVHRVMAEHRPSHVITLLSPGAEDPVGRDLDPANRLELRFHDIAEARDGLVAPTAEMVGRLIAFGGAWPGEAPLLVHCYAGVSRSTAAAFVLACARSNAGEEDALAGMLRAASPSATPNRLIVALADRLLGRGGRMSDAIARLGRGAEAFEGETFCLRLPRSDAPTP